jgi:hypothetical protein
MDFSNFIQDFQLTNSLPKPTFPRVLQIKGSGIKRDSHATKVSFMTLVDTCNLSGASISCNTQEPVLLSVYRSVCLCVFWTDGYSGNLFRIWTVTFR